MNCETGTMHEAMNTNIQGDDKMKTVRRNTLFGTPKGAVRPSRTRLSGARSKIVLLLVCMLLMLGSTGVARADLHTAFNTTQCVQSSDGLRLRSGPGTGNRIITAFPNGTSVTVISTQGRWSKVRVGWRTGWMYSSYLGDCDSGCDPNYSGYCVPKVPYDLDCKDVGKDFLVIGRDIHGFDGDGDGIACESYWRDSSSASSGSSSTIDCDSNYSGYCVPIVSNDLNCKDVGSNFRLIGRDIHGFDGDGDGWCCER